MLLLGTVVIALASESEALDVAVTGTPLRVFLCLYAVCLVGATLTIPRGVYDPLYLAFNWTETVLLTVGVGMLIVMVGTAHSLLWLLYFSTVLHAARAALYRRFNYVVFTLAPIAIAAGFAWRRDAYSAVVALALGATALYLHRLFLAATDRQHALEAAHEQLRKRVADLAIVEERERIARDLHDGFGASLTAAVWQARRGAETPTNAAIEARLMGCLDELGALVWATRRDHRDLATFWSHLRARCDDLFGAEVRIEYVLPADGPNTLDDRTAVAALFIVFEALRNSIRHAGARTVHVSGTANADAITLDIRDDGAGFDLTTAVRGHGLQHMEERASGVGGKLAIESRAGQTLVRARFPAAARTD